jgi:tetratricopeptide (TPR) repeat protein
MRPGAKVQLDVKEPLYIIELGVGSGKFTYFMLKALEEMKSICDFPFDKIVYVMTDFTENNYKFWMNHPALKPYFASGRLDAGIFDAVNDDHIRLHFSGKTLSANTCVNPVCIVANYLFDTLYHDIFQVDSNGILKEGLISVGSRQAVEPDPLDPEIISRLDNEYKYVPISCDSYYKDEDGDEPCIRRILKWYQEYFKATSSGASILLPIGALRALRKLCRFSNNRALIISGDKGNNNPDQFVGLSDPHIAVHGSFSLMVNYHAIGAWITNKGGFTLNNPQEEASLKVGCFVLQGGEVNSELSHDEAYLGDKLASYDEDRSLAYPYLKQAFEDFLNSFGPNDFFVMQKSLKEDVSNPPLRTVISILKLSDWDPDVFFKFRDIILTQAPTCGVKLRNDLSRGIPRVWKNYYIMDLEKDIAFEIGRYYYGIRNYDDALKYYTESVGTVGDHHVTFHNQGLCYYSLGKYELALEYFKRAVALNADYEKAKSWIEKVTKELSLRAATIAATTTSSNSNGSLERLIEERQLEKEVLISMDELADHVAETAIKS